MGIRIRILLIPNRQLKEIHYCASKYLHSADFFVSLSRKNKDKAGQRRSQLQGKSLKANWLFILQARMYISIYIQYPNKLQVEKGNHVYVLLSTAWYSFLFGYPTIISYHITYIYVFIVTIFSLWLSVTLRLLVKSANNGIIIVPDTSGFVVGNIIFLHLHVDARVNSTINGKEAQSQNGCVPTVE